jgi:tetratricopeptide (TPR) repeat protein/MinD-like ATPase involved in chromosome partitioning or flagellar assembly
MIISFYSYKGGVGRSQLCANVAAYLCIKKGKRVLLWDWDFEAPGLHYFFRKKNEDIKNIGTIEMLESYVGLMRSTPNVEEDDIRFLPPESIIHLLEGEPVKGKSGTVDLIPGGNYNEHFVYKVNSFNWFEFYELLDGSTYIEKLKDWIGTLEYDYVLIDSRTGINDYSGICNIQMPDTNVIVTAANEQNLAGSSRIVTQILNAEYTLSGMRKSYILPVLSRIDTGHPEYEYWISRFVTEFSHLLKSFDSDIDDSFVEEIFRDFYLTKTCLEYVPTYSAGENLLITSLKQHISSSSFTSKYVNIGDYLDNLNSNDSTGIFNQVSKDSWIAYAENSEIHDDREKAAIAYSHADEFDKSIELGGTLRAFMQKGNDFNLKGSFDKAIEFYQKALEFDSLNSTALFNTGFAYSNKKEFDKAIEFYQKALEIDPDDSLALFNIGVMYGEKKDYDKAIEFYQEALKLHPDDALALTNMGAAYSEKGDYDKAIEFYEKAIESSPDDVIALTNMGVVYNSKKDFDKAISFYKRVIEIQPDYYDALLSMGITYGSRKNAGKSIEYYRKAIDVKPDAWEAWNGMGFSQFTIGDVDSAAAAFQKAVDLGCDDLGNMNLGHIYLARKDEEGALALYKKSFAAFTDKSKFWTDMTEDFLSVKQYGISKKYYDTILEKLGQVRS